MQERRKQEERPYQGELDVARTGVIYGDDPQPWDAQNPGRFISPPKQYRGVSMSTCPNRKATSCFVDQGADLAYTISMDPSYRIMVAAQPAAASRMHVLLEVGR